MTRTSLLFAISLATLAAFALHSSNGIASSGPVSISDLAPADEYFGREHISPLGIRHTIFSLKDDLHHARRRPDAIAHDAGLVQDAVTDWAQRFPRDSWLPATLWNLAVLYEELPGTQAHDSAVAILQELRDNFSDSALASDAAHDLSRGIGVRPWPRWAGTPPPTMDPVIDADSLVEAIGSTKSAPSAQQQEAATLALEDRFFALSHGGADPAYARAAWELASAFERLPGEDAQTQTIRLLALLVDRDPDVVFGRWAMRDLKRGVGERS